MERIMEGQNMLAIISIVVSVILAIAVARVYGDVRAAKLMIEHEMRKATERRKRILIALHAQVTSLPRISSHNQTAAEKREAPMHLLPMPYPIVPFETAVFSANGISVSDETIEAATDYLLEARQLNVLIEALRNARLTSTGGDIEVSLIAQIQQFIRNQVDDQTQDGILQRIESLKTCIESEQKS